MRSLPAEKNGRVGERFGSALSWTVSLTVLILTAGCGTTAYEATGTTHEATPETFEATFAQLEPGDVMVLSDGTYPPIHIDGSRNGKPDAPITIRAKNERRARVLSDGSRPALLIQDAEWWVIDGLQLQNQDHEDYVDAGGTGGLVLLKNAHHNVVRRTLCHHPNRWGNNTGIKVAQGSTYNLVEENELYDFHRNGISTHGLETQHNVFRRNYANPRSTERLGRSWGPNDGYVMYGGKHSILENNISEFGEHEGISFAVWGEGTREYGNIALGGKRGFIVVQKGSPARFVGDGSELAHNLAINSSFYGFLTGSVVDVTISNGTTLGAHRAGVRMADMRPDVRLSPAPPDISMVNMLSVDSRGPGFEVDRPERFDQHRIAYSGGWNNAAGTWGPGADPESPVDVDAYEDWPTPVYIPEGSALASAGKNGAGVGATILYRYADGELTDEPLWNPETGAFPHGAVIEGVNDRPGESLFDVHQRLNVSPANLPARYGNAIAGR